MNRLSIAILLALTASYAAAQTVELRATMTGFSQGKAKWKTKDVGAEKQAEIEISAGPLQPNKLYKVSSAGFTWQAVTTSLGAFKVNKTYFGANRPKIVPGTWIVMRNTAGAVVLAGKFN